MVVQLCLALCYPMNCSPTGSSVYRISQGRIPETVAIFSSSGSSQPRDRTHISCVSCIGRLILYHRVTWEAHLSIYTHTYIYMIWRSQHGWDMNGQGGLPSPKVKGKDSCQWRHNRQQGKWDWKERKPWAPPRGTYLVITVVAGNLKIKFF